MPPEIEPLMTPAEVAALFHVNAKTVTRWAISGRLPVAARTLGGHRRFRTSDVRALYLAGAEPRSGADG